MGSPWGRRAVGTGLRVLGSAIMAGAALAAVALPSSRSFGIALADPLSAVFHRAVLLADVSAASATPTPRPSRTAAPQLGHGGPLTFSLSGNLSVGERLQQTTYSNSSADTRAFGNQSAANNNAGLFLQVGRRTATTSLNFEAPMGIGNGGTHLGELQGVYATPHFALGYAAQYLSLLGTVPLGGTLRGMSLSLPFGTGSIDLFEGPAYAENQSIARVEGIRVRRLVGGTLVEGGAGEAVDPTIGERLAYLVVGEAHAQGPLSEVYEAAFERRRFTGAPPISGFASQFRVDYGGENAYFTATARHVSSRFLMLGAGESSADSHFSLGYHTRVGSSGQIAYEGDFESLGSAQSQLYEHRDGLSYYGSTGNQRISYGLFLQDQHLIGALQNAYADGAGLQLGTAFGQTGILLGVQAMRTAAQRASPQATMVYQVTLQRLVGAYSAQLSEQLSRQYTAGALPSSQAVASASVGRIFGRTTLSLGYTQARISSSFSNVVETTPQLTIGRQISPALSLAVTYGQQQLRDLGNPANDARTRLFNVQVNAPFAFGNGLVQGRIDPRLPATIGGIVTADLNGFSTLVGGLSGGVGNVAVVLDGTTVQRTDLTGHFQFNFVSPGEHTLRVETASLPRGVTVDQPVLAVTVYGGQTGQVAFHLGAFGVVEGTVYGRDSAGNLYPLDGVELRIDGGAVAQTATTGAYAFGRLAAGKHVIQIDPESVPASVSFASDQRKQVVEVRTGEVTDLNFVAAPLGSIAGKVTYEAGMTGGRSGGVENAYVVAEPGEHAVITNADGSYLLDDLPAGTYTIDVDPETLPPDTGTQGGSQSVDLHGGDHIQGIDFAVGPKAKPVIFSLKQPGNTPLPPPLELIPKRVPPGAQVRLELAAAPSAGGIVALAFGQTQTLAYDRKAKVWAGSFVVPLNAHEGPAHVAVRQRSGLESGADLHVDPRMPLIIAQLDPQNAAPGSHVVVHMRILADARAGDRIVWQDGAVTVLPPPLAGHVFSFSVVLASRPYRGILTTRHERVPVLLR